MDVDPAVSCTDGFPFRGVIHRAQKFDVGTALVAWQIRCSKKTTPVDKTRIITLFFQGRCIRCCRDTLVGGHTNDADLAGLFHRHCLGKTGGQSVDFTGKQCGHGLAASIKGNVLDAGRIRTGCLESHRRD